MTPRKVDTLYSEVAGEIGVSEDLVNDVITFYWKAVKKELDEPTCVLIQLDHFGSFEIKRRQVEYQIEKQKRIIKGIKPTTYAKHTLLDIAIKKLAQLERVITLCEEQELKKKQIREKQKNG